MQCNIDAKGRTVRRNGGIFNLVLGLLLLGVAIPGWAGAARWPLVGIGAFLVVIGLFMLFEARKGWCAARALGFKTPV